MAYQQISDDYYVANRSPDNNKKRVIKKVDGILVENDLGLDLFLRKEDEKGKGWMLCEGITGSCIGVIEKTKAIAIKVGLERIKNRQPIHRPFKWFINKFVKAWGVVPRYKKVKGKPKMFVSKIKPEIKPVKKVRRDFAL